MHILVVKKGSSDIGFITNGVVFEDHMAFSTGSKRSKYIIWFSVVILLLNVNSKLLNINLQLKTPNF